MNDNFPQLGSFNNSDSKTFNKKRSEGGFSEREDGRHLHLSNSPVKNVMYSTESLTNLNGRTMSLYDLKKARKQIETDAKLLANRVNMLKNEENRVLKKIDETKKRAKELSDLKNKNDQKYTNMMKSKSQNLLSLQNNRNVFIEMRKQRHDGIKELQNKIYLDKLGDANRIKLDRKNNEKKKNSKKMEALMMNQQRKNDIKTHEDIVLQKMNDFKQKKINTAKKNYDKRMDQEQRAIEKKAKEILKFEAVENELLKKLQNTQLVEKSVYDQLEGVINSTVTPVKNRTTSQEL